MTTTIEALHDTLYATYADLALWRFEWQGHQAGLTQDYDHPNGVWFLTYFLHDGHSRREIAALAVRRQEYQR